MEYCCPRATVSLRLEPGPPRRTRFHLCRCESYPTAFPLVEICRPRATYHSRPIVRLFPPMENCRPRATVLWMLRCCPRAIPFPCLSDCLFPLVEVCPPRRTYPPITACLVPLLRCCPRATSHSRPIVRLFPPMEYGYPRVTVSLRLEPCRPRETRFHPCCPTAARLVLPADFGHLVGYVRARAVGGALVDGAGHELHAAIISDSRSTARSIP